MPAYGDKLDEIIAHKRAAVTQLKNISQADLKPSTRDLCHFIATQKREVTVIAELKKATPFRGSLISRPIDAAAWALDYENSGAAAISVLTDQLFFNGSLEDLQAVSDKVALPVIRKDFIVDARQIYEARVYGADAVLLIVRCLADSELKSFIDVCHAVHMRALVEIHDEKDLARALAAGARVIGINNRNLKDGSVDLSITERLAPLVPQNIVSVSESGISNPGDVTSLKGLVDAVLVGSSLMTAADPKALLASLVQAGEGA